MKFMKPEVLVSATAMVTAVAAVFVSIEQTDLMRVEADLMRKEAEMEREHQRLSVQPSVWVENNLKANNLDINAPGEFRMEFGNRGLGPARIMYITVRYKGAYVSNWSEWGSSVLDPVEGGDYGILNLSTSTIPQEYILPQDTSHEAFRVEAPTNFVSKLREASAETEFNVCFCSLYDDCWLTEGLEQPPKPINRCDIGDKPNFTSRWD